MKPIKIQDPKFLGEIFRDLCVKPSPGATLVIGSKLYKNREDQRKWFPNAIGVDMAPGEGVDVVCDLEAPLQETYGHGLLTPGTFDHMVCTSVLEHCNRPWLVAANMEKLLRPGGTLHLSVPFVWREHSYPTDNYRFTVHGIRYLFPNIAWEHLMYGNMQLPADMSVMGDKDAQGFRHFPRTEVFGFGRKL